MLSSEDKNNVLTALADLIDGQRNEILTANQKDLRSYTGDDASMYDRLKVDEKKIDAMIVAVKDCVAHKDPENEVIYSYDHPNQMRVENRTVALGTILIIYESRPDVTIEAAITAFKAGNKILLKGGKEARQTNLVLVDLWEKALTANGFDSTWVRYLDISRNEVQELIKDQDNGIDLIIPRGGEGLINFVKNHSNVPVIVSGRGNNFLYIDAECRFDMAVDLVVDGKKRISVCNALDKVLVHSDLNGLEEKLSTLNRRLKDTGIEVMGDGSVTALVSGLKRNTDAGVWEEEFLAPRIFIALTESTDDAIATINRYSGKHSATIVTENPSHARQFLLEVDCAAVYHNASTRFTDGGQFGFGAEMAISTQKLHFRGPIGMDQLVTNKWMIFGSGQTRN